jgi:hypothetical protein
MVILINRLENIHEMKKDVTELSIMIEEIEKNVRFMMDRRSKHGDITSDIVASIKHITVFKVLVILVISGLQVMLIKKFYAGSKKIGNPFYETGI